MTILVGSCILAVATLAQIAYVLAHRRPVDRARAEARSVPSFRFVYPMVMVALFLVGGDLLLAGGTWLGAVAVPPVVVVCGLVGMVGGSALFVWARRSLGGNYSPCFASRRPYSVVRHGAYRWLRHPMYVGNLATIAGAVAASGSWLLGIAWSVVACAYWRAARDENALLHAVPSGS